MPDGYEVFAPQNLRAVELIDMDRGDKMSTDDFMYAFQENLNLILIQSIV